jgi:hypothetical protein
MVAVWRGRRMSHASMHAPTAAQSSPPPPPPPFPPTHAHVRVTRQAARSTPHSARQVVLVEVPQPLHVPQVLGGQLSSQARAQRRRRRSKHLCQAGGDSGAAGGRGGPRLQQQQEQQRAAVPGHEARGLAARLQPHHGQLRAAARGAPRAAAAAAAAACVPVRQPHRLQHAVGPALPSRCQREAHDVRLQGGAAASVTRDDGQRVATPADAVACGAKARGSTAATSAGSASASRCCVAHPAVWCACGAV